MLSEKHRAYLLSRGYVEQMIQAEPACTIGALGLSCLVPDSAAGWIGWECRSMGGAQIGMQVKDSENSSYRWFQRVEANHLPIMYAIPEDYRILWKTGEVFVVEGIFDRVAMKRMFPEKATIARLSKSVAKQLVIFLERYARRVWLVMDMDEHGQEGAEQASKRLGGGILTERLMYPAMDPAELLKKKGVHGGREILELQMGRLGIF